MSEVLYAGGIEFFNAGSGHDAIANLRANPTDPLVLIVSGFEFGNTLHGASDDDGYFLACQMLANYVNGRLGSQEDVAIAANIARYANEFKF